MYWRTHLRLHISPMTEILPPLKSRKDKKYGGQLLWLSSLASLGSSSSKLHPKQPCADDFCPPEHTSGTSLHHNNRPLSNSFYSTKTPPLSPNRLTYLGAKLYSSVTPVFCKTVSKFSLTVSPNQLQQNT